jgi:hypothetical protein
MTGYPQFNFPLFDRAAEHFRKCRVNVISPAELDPPDVRAYCLGSPDGDSSKLPAGLSYGSALGRDIQVIMDQVTDGLILLPNWWESKGARLEVYAALLKGLPYYFSFQDAGSYNLSADEVVKFGTITLLTPDNIKATLTRFMP